ncbi:MAG: leucyl aminopeptidase [Alphaproteobacteria bacterium]|nr:leucyl aminopeptidase [Alphaproteobacteria bacterium]
MSLQILPSDSLTAPTDLLVLGVSASAPHALPAGVFDAAVDLLQDEGFEGRAGSTFALRPLGAVDARWVLIVGTGGGSAPELRLAAGAAGSFARDKGLGKATLSLGALDAAGAAAVAEGLAEGNYRYDTHIPEGARKAPLQSVSIVADDSEALRSGLDRGQALARARRLSRDLVNATPAELYPETLAEAALRLADDLVTVEVWDFDRIREAGMVGITAVGQGSDREPRYIHLTYTPAVEPVAEVALVGKGVTFDAGGYSLKTSAGMLTMKCDMGGAAAVLGAVAGARALGLPVKVHGIIGAVENLVSGNAFKLGDILRYRNGVTVEIHNTDAEGRLVLADCLIEACKLGADHVVDLATLTGAAVVALGPHYSALYSDDESLAGALLSGASESGEGFWRMPLEPLYKEMLKGDYSQIKNVGGRPAGSITAALFLSHFVAEGQSWAHLDIAGPAFLDQAERHLAKGGTGAGAAALVYWMQSLGG